jgi:hypothetical protein
VIRMRWLKGWITHPRLWLDVAVFAAIGAAVIFAMVVLLGWW